jgi:hypothetical protein
LKYKFKDTGETGEMEFDHKPTAPEIREHLGIENICEELEYARVYKGRKLVYQYPCPKRKSKGESELDTLAKELLKDFVKEAIEELRAKRNLSPKDILAQLLAEHHISKDLYNALKEIYERERGGSSFFSDFINFLRMLRELQAFNIVQQAIPQPTPQSPQQIVQQSITNTASGVAQVLSELMKMSPQERERVLNEALAKISEQFPQLKQYVDNFRSEARSQSNQ